MKKYIENWENFVEKSCDMLNKTCHNSRISLKYRNKPARGKLSVTDSNKNHRYLFNDTKSIDKLDIFSKKFLFILANKPMPVEETPKVNVEVRTEKKDNKNKKNNKKGKKN